MNRPWNILLIDDDEDDYIIFRGMLVDAREGSYKIEWAKDYQTGIKAACTGNHDAILVDNILGPYRGLKLIEEAGQQGAKGPFIILTGKGRERDDLEALRAGAVDYLDKNTVTSTLLEKSIRYAVQRSEVEQALQESQKKYQDIVASIRDGFMVVNHGWDIVYANEEALAGQEVQPTDVMGQKLWDVYPSLKGTITEANYRAAMIDRQPRRFEGKGIYLPESWFEISVYPSEEGISIFWTDITNRKNMEDERSVVTEELRVTLEELQVANDEAIKLTIEARETAATMEAVINNLNDAVLVFDENDKTVQANPYALKIFGFDPLGMSLSRILLSTDMRVTVGNTFSVWEKQSRLIDNPAPVTDLPAEFRNGAGESYSVLFSIIPLDHTSPRPGNVMVLKDMTQEVKVLLQVQESEKHYRDLFTGMTEGFALHEIITDGHGDPVDYRFLEVNPSFERLTGLAREQVIGKKMSEVLPDEDPTWVQRYGEVALTGQPVHFDSYSPALKQFYEVYAYCPAPRQFAVLFMNITERKRMEENLQVSLTKYETLFNAFPLGITVSGPEGNVLESNQEAERLLGVSGEEHSQRSIDSPDWKIISPNGEPMPAEEYASVRALKEKRRVENVVLGVQHEDGEVVWLNVTATPLPLEGYGVVVAYSDITEHRRMETEAVEQRAQIEVQRRLIRQRELERLVIARNLHDGPFQTLNAAHMGLMDVLRHEEDPEHVERLQWVKETFSQEIQEMRTFIQELRPPALVSFGVQTTIRSHLDRFSQLYPSIEIETELMRDGVILSEETRLALYRIYQELMTNAGKHSSATRIKISLLLDKKDVTLEVSDNGVGFTVPEQWTDLALTNHLGLIGIRERAEMIGAKLEIQSADGAGTVVRVIVPINREAA